MLIIILELAVALDNFVRVQIIHVTTRAQMVHRLMVQTALVSIQMMIRSWSAYVKMDKPVTIRMELVLPALVVEVRLLVEVGFLLVLLF